MGIFDFLRGKKEDLKRDTSGDGASSVMPISNDNDGEQDQAASEQQPTESGWSDSSSSGGGGDGGGGDGGGGS